MQENNIASIYDGLAPTVFAQYHFNHQEFPDRCTGTVDFLTDIELLAHCDYAALTFNSGLAHLVDVLRVALYGKHRSTFLDASNERCAHCEGMLEWLFICILL